MSTFSWLEIPFLIIGVALILSGGYLYFHQWSHVNIKTRAYTYISEAERNKRSLKAGFSALMFIFGMFFIISVTSIKPITIQNIISILTLGACSAPLIVLAAIFRMRKDLEPYTKLKDDVVFLEKNKNQK